MMNIKGFTILEMIIVLSIITLIFLLTLPNIRSKQQEIQNKQCNKINNQEECICEKLR